MSASEPLDDPRRKRRDDVRTRGQSLIWAISLGGTCLLPSRRPARRRRELGFRLLCGTWEPVPPMPRERLKRPTRKSHEYRSGMQGAESRVVVRKVL